MARNQREREAVRMLAKRLIGQEALWRENSYAASSYNETARGLVAARRL